jgi:cell division protein FtsL
MKNEVLKIYTTLCFILVVFVGIMSFSMIVKTNNITQLKMEVGNLKKEIEHLNKQISEDSLTIKTMEEENYGTNKPKQR